MGEPRVKGTLLQGVAATVQGYVEQGALSVEDLEARLSAETLSLLEQKLLIIRWYPVVAYRELLDVVWEVDGRRRPEFLLQLGEAAAKGLLMSDTYRSFLDSARASEHRSVDELLRRARVTIRLTDMFYDFVRVSAHYDDQWHRLELIYDEVEPFSEAMVLATQGFLNGLLDLVADPNPDLGPLLWKMERPEPARVIFSQDIDNLLGIG
ncbi:MAG: hypothetical protein MJE66_18670 [Proteobacteria bacterium]|nr:hypothetical protein [Pseudomonadota bacterium]